MHTRERERECVSIDLKYYRSAVCIYRDECVNHVLCMAVPYKLLTKLPPYQSKSFFLQVNDHDALHASPKKHVPIRKKDKWNGMVCENREYNITYEITNIT